MDAEIWLEYKSLLVNKKLSFKSREWYLRWAKAFENSLKNKSLSECTKENAQAYMNALIKRNKYQDWQLQQANNALRLLFGECLSLPWAKPWPVATENKITEGSSFNERSSKKYSSCEFKDVINWEGVEINCPGVLDRIKTVLRTLHYAYRTEQTYLEWICRYLTFNGFKEPDKLSAVDVRIYLEYLATEREIAGNTQKQALNAIAFLYNKVLQKPFGEIGPYERPKLPKRLPVVLTREETNKVFCGLSGKYALMAGLLYGSGLRLLECVRLRVKDVDFGHQQIVVRNGKGGKDRVTILPTKYEVELKEHLKSIKIQHEKNLTQGHGEVYLWASLERKYRNIAKE